MPDINVFAISAITVMYNISLPADLRRLKYFSCCCWSDRVVDTTYGVVFGETGMGEVTRVSVYRGFRLELSTKRVLRVASGNEEEDCGGGDGDEPSARVGMVELKGDENFVFMLT